MVDCEGEEVNGFIGGRGGGGVPYAGGCTTINNDDLTFFNNCFSASLEHKERKTPCLLIVGLSLSFSLYLFFFIIIIVFVFFV